MFKLGDYTGVASSRQEVGLGLNLALEPGIDNLVNFNTDAVIHICRTVSSHA